MIRQLYNVANYFLNKFGYEIYRKPPEFFISDPFEQQRQFFNNNSPSIIFDVGAHVGEVTKKYRHMFPEAHIHVFEPFGKPYNDLKNFLSSDTKLTINQLALADRIGTVTLNVNRSSATNSLLQTDESSANFWKRDLLETYDHVSVDVITIDSYCQQHSIDHIDILKLDIQGSEMAALKGAKTLLEKGGISLIYIELLIAPTYINQTGFHEIIGYLKKYGMEIFNIYDMHYKQNQLIQLDAICVLSSQQSA